jgi:hypothetical protein
LSKCKQDAAVLAKPEVPVSAARARKQRGGQVNKRYVPTQRENMGKMRSKASQERTMSSKVKHRTSYTCRDKGPMSKDCPIVTPSNTILLNNSISH